MMANMCIGEGMLETLAGDNLDPFCLFDRNLGWLRMYILSIPEPYCKQMECRCQWISAQEIGGKTN